MADFRYPTLVKSGRKLQIQLASALAGIGVALLFVAIQFESKGFVAAKPISSRPRTYSRMWFHDEDALVGAFRNGTKLSIDYWSPAGSIADTLEVELSGAEANDEAWAVDASSSRVAWISGKNLYCRMLPVQAKPTVVSLEAGQALPAVGILSDGSIAVPFADSVVRRWDCTTGRPRGESPIALQKPDQAVMEGDYLAVSSSTNRALHLYRFRDPQLWTVTEESPLPDPPYVLAIPAPGFMIAKTAKGFQQNGKTRITPGVVRSVIPEVGDLVITGDFDKALILPAEGERYPIADAPPNSLAAASKTHLALSSERGTTFLQLLIESRMSGRGRAFSYTGVGLLLGSAVVVCLAFTSEGALLGILMRLKGRPQKLKIDTKIRKPPPELLAACAAGETVLWAGAGLSAQAGFPDRTAFVTGLLRTASLENWMPGPHVTKLGGLLAKGDPEGAMEGLVVEMSAHRSKLISELKAIFGGSATASKAHSVLPRIGFASAITTNYDNLLERIGEPWSGNVLNSESDYPVDSAHLPFLLKLYGDLGLPQTVLLTRSELRAALDHSQIAALFRRVCEIRTVLFVGCTTQGLLADLAMLDAPRKMLNRHYLVTGVIGEEWKTSADELTSRYGIEVLDCDTEMIGASLAEFLNELAQGVEEIRSGSKASPKVDLINS